MQNDNVKTIATNIAAQLERAVDRKIAKDETDKSNRQGIDDGIILMISAMHSIANGDQKNVSREVISQFKEQNEVISQIDVGKIKLELAKNAMIDTAPHSQQPERTHASSVSRR